MISKQEYNQLIGKRLLEAIELLGYNQRKVLLMCDEKGYKISQSALSKILSGSNIQTMQVAQICDVLELNISEVLSFDMGTKVHLKKDMHKKSNQIITDARDNAFRGYKGKYNIYFYTTKNEDYIHRGTFELGEDPVSHQCNVDFRFKTGEKDENGNDIEKRYIGEAYYSVPMQTVYCTMMSEEIGEISYLLFHYDFLTYQQLESRLASAITASSGIKRLPTMHKFLLTRKELSSSDLDYLCGQLKLNTSEILISENAYRGFLQDEKLPQSFFKYFGLENGNTEGFTSSIAKVNYYSFNESLISDSFLPALDKMKIICLLRKYSVAPQYNKISGKAEEIIYKYLRIKEKNLETEEIDNI